MCLAMRHLTSLTPHLDSTDGKAWNIPAVLGQVKHSQHRRRLSANAPCEDLLKVIQKSV